MRKLSNQFQFSSDNDKKDQNSQIQQLPLLLSSSSQNKNEESVSDRENSHEQSQQKVQRRRRTRKDSGAAREYICPCGKNYLSYPALYTHIKQKHNSVPPGEIVKPSNSQLNKNIQNSITSSGSGGSADEAQDSPSVPSIQTQVIDKNTFLQSIAIPTTGEPRKLTKEEAESLIAWQIAASYYHGGLNSRISPYYQMLFNQYKSVYRVTQIGSNENTILNNNELSIEKLKTNISDGLKEATINQALILFLLEVENFLDTHQYSLLGLFSYLFRRAINDIFYGTHFKIKHKKKKRAKGCIQRILEKQLTFL